MNEPISNHLTILQGQIREAHEDVRQHDAAAATKALAAGEMLVEATALCRHGEWASWLKETGIPERSAQRYMLLHRAGFKSATVADLGWATAERCASTGLRLFPAPRYLTIGGGRLTDHVSFGFWAWRHTDELAGYGFLDANLRYLKERQPMPIWGLGFIHEVFTEGATYTGLNKVPADAPLPADPLGEFPAEPPYETLAKFTSLELAPWCLSSGELDQVGK